MSVQEILAKWTAGEINDDIANVELAKIDGINWHLDSDKNVLTPKERAETVCLDDRYTGYGLHDYGAGAPHKVFIKDNTFNVTNVIPAEGDLFCILGKWFKIHTIREGDTLKAAYINGDKPLGI